jgi:hypothetical protein
MTELVAGWSLEEWAAGLRAALQRIGVQAVSHAEARRIETTLGNSQARSDAGGLRARVSHLDSQVQSTSPLPALINMAVPEWRSEEAHRDVVIGEHRRALAELCTKTDVAMNRLQRARAGLLARMSHMATLLDSIADAELSVHERIVSLEECGVTIRQVDANIREIERRLT